MHATRQRTYGIDTTHLTAVIMARQPIPGRVKTRLVASGLTPESAASIAAGMLRCTIARIRMTFGGTVLAVTPDGAGAAMRKSLRLGDVRIVDQGRGDLGRRLDRVWGIVGHDRPVAFFGMDSPDVPAALLETIPVALDDHDVAVGPTGDGGYWTLAARRYAGDVLRQIDWGSESVYDQTRLRAREARLRWFELPEWEDVDNAGDLVALRARLGRLKERSGSDAGDPDPLIELRRCLDETLGVSSPSDAAP